MKYAIFIVIFLIVVAAIVALPTIHIDASAVISSNAFSYIRAGLYFFPMGTVRAILAIILVLWILRVIIAFIKMIWDLLPVA
jgi:hypothetical protein